MKKILQQIIECTSFTLFKKGSECIFTLGRKIQLDDKTNVSIVLFSLSAFILGGMFTGEIRSGFSLGGGVFLTWALTREIDPIHSSSAFIAASLSLLHLNYMDAIHFLILAWVLLLLRAVNGITGKKLTLLDVFSALALTIFLSFSHENSIYLLIFILALIRLSLIKERKTAGLVSGVVSLILFVVQSVFLNYLSVVSMNQLSPLWFLVIALSTLLLILSKFLPTSKAIDDKGRKANHSRILYAQLLYGTAIILMALFGDMTFSDLVIYVAVIVGVIVNFIGNRIKTYF